jgi:hypothetical protein
LFPGFSETLVDNVYYVPQHLVDQVLGWSKFFSPPTHTMGGHKKGSDATPGFSVDSQTPFGCGSQTQNKQREG